MGAIDFVVHLATKPLGFIGVVLFLIGLWTGLTGNLLGWGGAIAGTFLAFISEKG